jgi:hypothetical protein
VRQVRNRHRHRVLLQKVLPTIPAEVTSFDTEAAEAREVDAYLAKLREHRRALKRERREKEQAAQVQPPPLLSRQTGFFLFIFYTSSVRVCSTAGGEQQSVANAQTVR